MSILNNGNLALALAPALTPQGYEKNPIFFEGMLRKPQILAKGLLTLADITMTRYFKYIPVSMRDPVISAQGDMLRAECFSACNGVYARLDILPDLLDGEMAFGTTNVDIGVKLRKMLVKVNPSDGLKLKIGEEGMGIFHTEGKEAGNLITKMIYQRPVEMPERWIRAFGNAASIHRNMKPIFCAKGMAAQSFISNLPTATSKEQSAWISYGKTGLKFGFRKTADSVYISGLHRLSALKRVMSDVCELCFYAPDESGAAMIQANLQGARLILSLTPKSWQGYSGEGSLLEALSNFETIENSQKILLDLKFESHIDEGQIIKKWGLSKKETDLSLALLCVDGKLGYDVQGGFYYHRELPEDSDRLWKDNPRLNSAKKLMDNLEQVDFDTWVVHSTDADYRVVYHDVEGLDKAKCSCTWYLNYQNKRGPCKHILAVKLKKDAENLRYQPK